LITGKTIVISREPLEFKAEVQLALRARSGFGTTLEGSMLFAIRSKKNFERRFAATNDGSQQRSPRALIVADYGAFSADRVREPTLKRRRSSRVRALSCFTLSSLRHSRALLADTSSVLPWSRESLAFDARSTSAWFPTHSV
jgi:hypothetical protein